MFSWNLPSESIPSSATTFPLSFQSLFSWNLPSERITRPGRITGPLGFNPCFLGTCPQSMKPLSFEFDLFRFQSLFSWNLPSESKSSAISQRDAGFNPCFLGTCPQSVLMQTDLIEEERFQSLFSWNLPSEKPSQNSDVEAAIVSILVFLELALRA